MRPVFRDKVKRRQGDKETARKQPNQQPSSNETTWFRRDKSATNSSAPRWFRPRNCNQRSCLPRQGQPKRAQQPKKTARRQPNRQPSLKRRRCSGRTNARPELTTGEGPDHRTSAGHAKLVRQPFTPPASQKGSTVYAVQDSQAAEARRTCPT